MITATMSIVDTTLTMLVLNACFKFGTAQPSIVDVTLYEHSAIIRWEVQCNDMTEVSEILYGCSRTNFQDNNMTTVRHSVNRNEAYREKTLLLFNDFYVGDGWKCVFKLIGVQYENCVTEDGNCILIDASTFVRPIIGMPLDNDYIKYFCAIILYTYNIHVLK